MKATQTEPEQTMSVDESAQPVSEPATSQRYPLDAGLLRQALRNRRIPSEAMMYLDGHLEDIAREYDRLVDAQSIDTPTEGATA